MNTEEIDYWLRLFSNNNQSFMSKDGKKITLFKVLQELKELHYLLKIKNDYIKELEAYKYNMDCDYLRLAKENQELKKELEEIYKFKFSYRKDETKIPPIIRKQKDVEIIKNLENQQKEFMKFLEDNWNTTQDIWYIKILQKYKEIIGVSDDKTN